MRFIYLIQRTHQDGHYDSYGDWEPGTPTVDILTEDCYITIQDCQRACADAYDIANKFIWNRSSRSHTPYNPKYDYCKYQFVPIKVAVKRFQISEHP